MKSPLISVILPVYNIEKYLPKCMESLFAQSYDNIEFIIIDDGSNKECAKLCDYYSFLDSRVTVYHKKNGGLSDARNYGIKRAKGEFITCVDPDDYVDRDYIEYLYSLIVKYSSKMSICQHRIHYENGKIREMGKLGDEEISSENCIWKMLYHDTVDTSAWAKMYHRSLFKSIEYPNGKLFEDISTTYLLMIKSKRIALGYESKYNYIFHDNSIVNSSFNKRKMDLLEMTDKMAMDVIRIYPELEKAVLRRRVYSRFSTLNQMLSTELYEVEKEEIIEFIKKYRKNIILDKNAPNRDKIAMFFISINYKLYRVIWLKYRKYLMKYSN